ncbi:MAG: GNAT family N-acetyltransferase [Calditrichaeota bacterium]|nr:GNAT family N-acetyltransferase [Calditrichota bacterium]
MNSAAQDPYSTASTQTASSADPKIRPAELDDLKAIIAIYDYAIAHTTATFDTEPRSEESQRTWFNQHGEAYPLLVAQTEDQIVGWAALSPWSDRCSYKTTAEVSIYIEKGHQGRGTGTRLMEALLKAGRQAGLHSAVARIVEGNPASIHLHEKAGFRKGGVMQEAGYKFGCYLDVIIMEKLLDGSRK